MQKSIDFEESLFYYNQDHNIWEEKSEIQIILEKNAVFKDKFDQKLPLLSIKSNNVNFPPQILSISHSYEFHYYPKNTFLSEKDFKSTNISKSNNIPLHVIVISKKEYDYNGDLMFYFEIFGCNCTNGNSKEKISLTLAKLYYEVRYSSLSIIQQVRERLEKILLKSFKAIVRYLGNMERYSFLTTAEYLYHLAKKNSIYEENVELLLEFENIVYKCLISEGLFPIYCEINTMNTNVIRLALSSILIPDSILPWSPKFHASFSIGDFHYSFNPNNRMNTKKMDNRTYRSNFFYVRIKILDFFPLDDWTKRIALFFFENLTEIFSCLKKRNENIFEEAEEIPAEPNRDNANTDFLLITQESIDPNKDPLKEPLIKKNGLLGKFFCKNAQKKKDEADRYGEKVNSFKKIIKNELLSYFLADFPQFDYIISNISLEFYENYKYELTNTQILWNICKIIARTELRQYETLSNNCQTPVAESLHIIHEKLKQFIEPLQEKKDFSIKSKKTQNDYFKFCSKLTRLMNEDKIIKPTILDCNLDYFGIYADKYLQRYLENIKKVTIFENFQKVNDKISFSEKNIEVLFENFGHKYRTIFDNMKDNLQGTFSRNLMSIGKNSHDTSNNDILLKNTNSENSFFKKEFMGERNTFFVNNSSLMPRKQVSLQHGLSRKDDSSLKKDLSFNSNLSKKDKSSLKEVSPKKKPKNNEKIYRAMSYFLFMCENIIYNYKIKIAFSQNQEEKRTLVLKKYELLNLYREFCYYYFNSIRLKNSYKLNKNNISYVGFVLIKDPAKVLFELPENGKEIYASAYM